MTILGAACDRDTAVVWADTLVTSSATGESAGHVCKLAVNGLAGVIGAGRGWGRLATDAEMALLAAPTLDDAVSAVCAALRRGAVRHAPSNERRHRFSFTGCGYVLAGWSDEAGRMVIWDLDARSMFEPAISTRIMAPPIERTSAAMPGLGEVEEIASRQAAELMARSGVDVGRLTIATITRHGITILPPREIARRPGTAADAGATPAPGEGSTGAGEATPSIHLAA
jgi:hypothetical protein